MDKETIYFYCSRSGFFVSETTGARSLKSQGSNKINAHCTATLTVTSDKHMELIRVELCDTHYDHDKQLGHLQISQSKRVEIAGQLSKGIPIDRILDGIRDSVSTKIDRIHLLTRKDIVNIEKAYGLKGVERHSNDSMSVALWVEEMRQKGVDNPVLLYKPQGNKATTDCQYLDNDDFVLILQAPLQCAMMKEFGNNIICVDSTHKTTGYDFQLTTVMIVDEYGEGYPVSWCLSNREDQILLTHYFEHLKKKTGRISPEWFMSDDFDGFYNAWISVFNRHPQKILCSWHVDRAWRSALKFISDKEQKCQIYHTLHTLLDEEDDNKFELLFNKFMTLIDNNQSTQRFAKYFKQEYSQRKHQWATCYRRTAGINTNMYVEAFHHTLKYLYMKGKINRRVDKCIHILMKIAKDKAFERLIKLEKGKTSYRIGIINSRHVHSIKLSIEAVRDTNCNEWTVTSTSKPETHYTIKKQQTICQNCHIRCKECNICIHEYTCTCPDSLLNVTMCKHIHLVIRYINSNFNRITAEPSNVPMKSLNVGNKEIFHEVKVLGEYTTTADM